jgi:SAM-dependent methyltransferase
LQSVCRSAAIALNETRHNLEDRFVVTMFKRLREPLKKRVGERRWRILRQLSRRITQPGLTAHLRIAPVSEEWGFDRGLPVDRWYIESFLDSHRSDITGNVLEVKSNVYTKRYGLHVVRSDIIDIDATNKDATIVADLANADHVSSEQFDCFLLNQTLQFIYNVDAAVGHAARLLKPGGVVLATVPCISRLAPRYGLDRDYWRFTQASCNRIFGQVFPGGKVEVSALGNMRSACAFLNGLAADEVPRRCFERHDPYYPVIIGVRAQKPRP